MEKMMKIAKDIKATAKACMIICFVFVGLLAVLAVILLFVDSSAFSELSTTITLGNVSFEIAPEYLPEGVYLKGRVIAALGAVVILLVYIALSMKCAENVLAPFAQGNPFDGAVAANLKKLGIYSLIFGVVYPLAEAAFQAYLLYVCDFKSVFIGDSILSMEMDFDIDLTYIIIAGVLFMLSYVFKYGAQLQNQADETL